MVLVSVILTDVPRRPGGFDASLKIVLPFKSFSSLAIALCFSNLGSGQSMAGRVKYRRVWVMLDPLKRNKKGP